MSKLMDLYANTESLQLYYNADISAAQTAGSAVDVKTGKHAFDEGEVQVIVNALTAAEGDYTFTIASSATSGGTYVTEATIQVTSANAGNPVKARIRNFDKFLKVTLAETTGETTVLVVPAFVIFNGIKERL